MKEIETELIERALKSERALEPSKFAVASTTGIEFVQYDSEGNYIDASNDTWAGPQPKE